MREIIPEINDKTQFLKNFMREIKDAIELNIRESVEIEFSKGKSVGNSSLDYFSVDVGNRTFSCCIEIKEIEAEN